MMGDDGVDAFGSHRDPAEPPAWDTDEWRREIAERYECGEGWGGD